MQIKPYDGARTPGSMSPAAPQPSEPPELGAKPAAVEGDSVSLSSGVRSLAAALRAALPMLEAARIAELLTPCDRTVLVRALDLVRAENLDPEQVHALIQDLIRYRAQERAENMRVLGQLVSQERTANDVREVQLPTKSASALPNAPNEEAPRHTERPLSFSLPALSRADEREARILLTSLALRDTAVDHGFVRALVDPDRTQAHAVDFGFLRRLVFSLSPAHADGARDKEVLLTRRDAREALERAFSALTVGPSDLSTPTREGLSLGRVLLRAQLAALAPELGPNEQQGSPLFALTRADRTLLGALYVASARANLDPHAVDEVARALVALRRSERAEVATVQRVLTLAPPPATAEPVAAQRDTLAQAAPARRHSLLPAPIELAAQRTAPAGSEPRPLPEHERQEEPGALAARTFGSPSQLAFKAAGSYRSLVPPPPTLAGQSPLPREFGVEPLVGLLARGELAANQQTLPQLPQLVARPLELGQAFGLAAWFHETRAKRRAARLRTRVRASQPGIRPVTAAAHTAAEADADDPLLEGARRRRVRWQLLIQRRRHTRKRRS